MRVNMTTGQQPHTRFRREMPKGRPRPWWEQVAKYVTVGAKTMEKIGLELWGRWIWEFHAF